MKIPPILFLALAFPAVCSQAAGTAPTGGQGGPSSQTESEASRSLPDSGSVAFTDETGTAKTPVPRRTRTPHFYRVTPVPTRVPHHRSKSRAKLAASADAGLSGTASTTPSPQEQLSPVSTTASVAP